jgi:hypothetical protein
MSLKGLIKNQTIIIDDHKRGNGEIKNWDDPGLDVHIDKTTNYPVNGKRQDVRIRIPINSNREIRIENSKSRQDEVPRQLLREIRNAFENTDTRERFISEIIEILLNFKTLLQSEERVEQILSNLSRHFDLEWTQEKIATYTNNILEVYTQIYTDDKNNQFYITIDKDKIKIAENNGYARHQKHLKRK